MRRLLPILLASAALSAQTAEWKLGTLQTTGFVGANLQEGRVGAKPSFGLGMDIGLNRHLVITTGWGWNRYDSSSRSTWLLGHGVEPDALMTTKMGISKHDLLAGPRLQFPSGTRITPFISALGGLAVTTVGVKETFRGGVNAIAKARDSFTKPAAGAGAGLEVRIGRGWSVLAEAKAIRPHELPWYGRCGLGFAYRPAKTD